MEERKIIDYIIIKDDYSINVETKVLEKIKEGYELLGGASCGGSGYTTYYTQAMVKYEK